MLSTIELKTAIYLTKHDLVHSLSTVLSYLDWKSKTQWSKHCWAVSKKYLLWAWKSTGSGAPYCY